jgi:aryl-alcohol dehydrogenase-like predicted oxidoreductase
MLYKRLGTTEVFISLVSMGGHEYLPSGLSRGFNEDMQLAIKPGHIFDGFGQEARRQVLRAAFEHGINFFDVTQDSEKEALGRNLREVKPPYEIYVQTRPESFGYTYDKNNVKLANCELLRAEVQRILKLIQRERVDFLNMPFMQAALDNDPDYMDKINYNIRELKREGLIRFAVADTFSGESTYITQIERGTFDAIYINFNFADFCPAEKVLPMAAAKGLGVFAREAFMKGELFHMAEEVGLGDTTALVAAALRWVLAHEEVTTLTYGTGKPGNLLSALRVLRNTTALPADGPLLGKIKGSERFKAYEARKTREFLG